MTDRVSGKMDHTQAAPEREFVAVGNPNINRRGLSDVGWTGCYRQQLAGLPPDGKSLDRGIQPVTVPVGGGVAAVGTQTAARVEAAPDTSGLSRPDAPDAPHAAADVVTVASPRTARRPLSPRGRLYLALGIVAVAALFLSAVHSVLRPFVWAAVVAYILNPIVCQVQRRLRLRHATEPRHRLRGFPRLPRRLLSGCYRMPAMQVDIRSVYTNKTPIAAYRGAGRPEAIFLIERMMDLAARELRIDPAEIRRRNLLPPFDEPILTILAAPGFPVLDRKLLEQHGGDGSTEAKTKDQASARLNDNSAGTGPYRPVRL